MCFIDVHLNRSSAVVMELTSASNGPDQRARAASLACALSSSSAPLDHSARISVADCVTQDDHAVAKPALLHELQVQPHTIGEEPLSAPHD